MKYFEKIKGHRLYLSPMDDADIEKYMKWMNDKEVVDNLDGHSKVIRLLLKKEYVEKKCDEYNFSIVKRESNELIGNISLFDVNFVNQSAALSIFIGERENRCKGYGKESVKLILDYGFNTLNLNNIMLSVREFNKVAISAYEKLGFKKIGVRRKCVYRDGKFYDEIYMDILKEEFNENKDFIFTG